MEERFIQLLSLCDRMLATDHPVQNYKLQSQVGQFVTAQKRELKQMLLDSLWEMRERASFYPADSLGTPETAIPEEYANEISYLYTACQHLQDDREKWGSLLELVGQLVVYLEKEPVEVNMGDIDDESITEYFYIVPTYLCDFLENVASEFEEAEGDQNLSQPEKVSGLV